LSAKNGSPGNTFINRLCLWGRFQISSEGAAQTRKKLCGGALPWEFAIFMKLAGFFWLVTGWVIVLAAVALLRAAAQAGFVLAGCVVQAAGLTQVVRAHLIPRGDKGNQA
jgi:hypothetical protein